MVYNSIGVNSQNVKTRAMKPSFCAEDKEKRSKCENHDTLLVKEQSKRPISTGLKIQTDKFINACTKYPQKGLSGSKNANFYEFLTMGMVPYVVGSGMMIAVFNAAAKFFDTPAAVNASKLGKKMGLGVIAYGLAKTFSKKLIELPVKWKHGIDVNMPYKKVVHELPEERNKDNLVTHEYHKVFESVDFPRWDLLYGNEHFGEGRNAYFNKVADKMGQNDGDLEHSDQKMKPKIKEKLIQTKVFSTLASYLWAATAVGVAMQSPWEGLVLNPKQIIKNRKNYGQSFVKDFGSRLVKSCKEFVNNPNKGAKIAGRALLGTAIGVTLLGNFMTLFDFNKDKGSKTQASTSLIDDTKEKVVC